MKNFPIGFNGRETKADSINTEITERENIKTARKSVVQVYFPHRSASWAYYNDSFDLKVGDLVYVEGKLYGFKGRVIEVNYSFKIKVSDYKKVIDVIDTKVNGDLYFVGSHVVTFDKQALSFSKVISWFKAPSDDNEYETGEDDSISFPIDDLSMMKLSDETAKNGYEYFSQNRVSFIELDGNKGCAIVEGKEIYEVSFNYIDGEISNLSCSCFCTGNCKHEFATLLQLREILEKLADNYKKEYVGYFAAISKDVFINTVVNEKVLGKISL